MRCLFVILFLWVSMPAAMAERVNPFANPGFNEVPRSGGTPAVPAELKLKAVMPAADAGLANINGHLLKIGDDYFGYVLTGVAASHVTLRKNDQDLVLELRPRNTDARGEQS